MAKPLTTDEWVRRLNKLAAEIDEWCMALHPSAWDNPEQPVVGLCEKYKELAKRPTYDPPAQTVFEFGKGESDESRGS